MSEGRAVDDCLGEDWSPLRSLPIARGESALWFKQRVSLPQWLCGCVVRGRPYP